MDLKHHLRPAAGAVFLLMLIAPVGLALLAGCSATDNPVRPSMLAPRDDGPGELILPMPDSPLPSPDGVRAKYLGNGIVLISWRTPGRDYETVITRDGVEIGRVNAQAGQFTDHVRLKTPYAVTYSVQFARGTRLGRPGSALVEIPESPMLGPIPDPEGDPGAGSGN